jgi:adenylate kinase family enzyme
VEVPGVQLALLRFRLRARRRAEWLRRPDLGSRAEELDAILEDRNTPEAEEEWAAAQPWAAQWRGELAEVERALDSDKTSPLANICAVFGLSAEDADLLQACTAVALDPALARLCAYLQNDARRSYITEELAARIYGHGRCGVWGADSPLFRWQLVAPRACAPGEPDALSLDPQVRDWLAGRHSLPELLTDAAKLLEPAEHISPPSVADLVDFIEQRLRTKPHGRARIMIEGSRGSGRHTLAAAVSAELSLPLFAINADLIDDRDWRSACLLAHRHAYVERTALAWSGGSLVRRTHPTNLPPFPVQFAIVEPGAELAAVEGVTDRRVRVPGLTVEERSALWRAHVPESCDWPQDDFRALAERYRVQAGDIVAAAAAGVKTAQQAGLRVREVSRGRLGNLAQLLRCSFTWEDLVAPPALREALEDIVYEANHRASFWESPEANRLFPQGQGLMALFSGPPGTGKTMAAQVMAATLGYDLFRVDLAGVVSKWVGETSQNFERILSRAADMHAIILFDECDAIFSKRTSEIQDAQDKFVNTDAAYLLQAIECYPGIALLATNQKGNIDPAFIRRLRYVLEFAKPDPALRLDLWRKVVAGLAGGDRCAALAPGLKVLADSIEATGAQIKFATLAAIFAAKKDGEPLDLRHLVRGMERELAKEGRALGRERERILRHGI